MKPAGFWIRLIAYIIDYFILGIPLFIIQMLLSGLFIGGSLIHHIMDPYLTSEPSFGLFVGYYLMTFMLSVVAGILYYGLMTASKYQGTLGKKLLGIKVVDKDGNRLSKGRAIARYFAYIPSALLFYIGFIMIAFGKKRGLHDIICKTKVVYVD